MWPRGSSLRGQRPCGAGPLQLADFRAAGGREQLDRPPRGDQPGQGGKRRGRSPPPPGDVLTCPVAPFVAAREGPGLDGRGDLTGRARKGGKKPAYKPGGKRGLSGRPEAGGRLLMVGVGSPRTTAGPQVGKATG